jgi:hypothetical protein
MMKVRRPFVMTLITCAAAALLALVTAAAVGPTIVVTPNNTQGWTTADTRPGGTVSYVVDPTAPGGGNGALRLTTDSTTAAKAQYMHEANAPLSSITELSYWTKQVSGPPHADASYQLPVCLGGFTSPVTPTNPTGCTGFTTLVFEPYQHNGSNPSTQAVVNGIWQMWDVDAGQFWSSKTATGGGTCNVQAGFGGAPFYTLAGLQASCPNAVVVGFGVNIGTFNPSYDVYTDLVNFNGTTYDFEPFVFATSRDQCKNGGYVDMRRADGSTFKNQGDCVSYTSNGK